MYKNLIIMPLLLLIILNGYSQVNTIQGKVTDISGQLLIGVNVTIEGTTRGTVTDKDGNYRIEIPSQNAVIVFSFMGYLTERVTYTGQDVLDVQLVIDIASLDEVVLIGYGSIRRRDLTGSMSVIRMDDLKTKKALSVGEVLQGMASGVKVTGNGNIGAEPNIQVRGIGNFGNSQPLYVIDGIISTGGLRDLNVNDIETVQILKDASTAAIYGNRAANGVVLITTRKGAEGEPRINFSSKFGIDRLPALNMMDTTEFFYYNDMAYANAGLAPQDHFKHSTDWEKEVLRTGYSQDINLDVSGAKNHLSYMVSCNYYSVHGTSIGTSLDRYSFRVNTEYKRGRFTVGENISVSRTEIIPPIGNPIVDAMRMQPNIPMYDSLNVGGYGFGNEARARTFGANHVAAMDFLRIKDWNTRIRGIVFGEVEILPYLKNRANFAYETSFDGSQHRRQIGNWTLNQPFEPNRLYDFSGRYESFLYENFLTFDKKIEGHSINAMIGISRHDQFYNFDQSEIRNFASWNEDITAIEDPIGADTITLDMSAKWYMLSYFTRLNYDYQGRYLLSASVRRDASSQFSEAHRVGYFPSIALGWVISNEEFYNIPFITNLKLKANYGELGNSAIVNWQNVTGLYDYIPILTTYPLYTFGNDVIHQGTIQRQLVNTDLRWETKQIANFGADIGLVRNKLQISADYFISTTKDVLLRYPILLATGNDGGNPWVNAGTLRNRGVELELTWRDYDGDFKYSISVNATKLQNEVLDLPYFDKSMTTGLAKTTIGQPLAMFYLIKADGIFQTPEEVLAHTTDVYNPETGQMEAVVIQPNAKPGDLRLVDYGQNGFISEADDRQYVGSPWPKFEGGLSFSASYKGFDLFLHGFGAYGQKVWNGKRTLIERFADNTNYPRGINPWTPENTNTTMPRLLYGDERNTRGVYDYWIEDGSYFKIQQVSLGYNFDKKHLGNFIHSVRVGLAVQNLYTITKYTGFDPAFDNGFKLEFGVDPLAYPTPTTYLFSLNFSF